jgi:hypothetical protein
MFGEPWIWMTGLAVFVVGLAIALAWAAMRRPRRTTVERARKLFHLQRERLEFRFFQLAAQIRKPRGLELVDCDFEDEVAFARDRHNGRLRAYVGVTIRFQAIEGGGMEDNPNVDNLKAGSAEFRLDESDWGTDGKVHFNVNPDEAIQRYQQELEPVE